MLGVNGCCVSGDSDFGGCRMVCGVVGSGLRGSLICACGLLSRFVEQRFGDAARTETVLAFGGLVSGPRVDLAGCDST